MTITDDDRRARDRQADRVLAAIAAVCIVVAAVAVWAAKAALS